MVSSVGETMRAALASIDEKEAFAVNPISHRICVPRTNHSLCQSARVLIEALVLGHNDRLAQGRRHIRERHPVAAPRAGVDACALQ